MAYLLYYALNREGESVRRLGQYEALQDLDKELALHGEELVDYHLLSDFAGRVLESVRGKPKPLEIAEFCTTLSHYVAGGIELQGALSDAAESASTSTMRSARPMRGASSIRMRSSSCPCQRALVRSDRSTTVEADSVRAGS